MAETQNHQAPGTTTTNTSTGGGAIQFVAPLYIGDLDSNVTDSQLYDFFCQIGTITSVRVCRDMSTQRSLGYGYVNYNSAEDAARALDELNFTPLNGKPIRIMYSQRDPSIRKSGNANVFIKNLDKTIDHKILYDTFSNFGKIISCKVATEPSGESKGYGYVHYDNEESAQKAIDEFNGKSINDKQVYIEPFLRKQEREKFNNVFVKNLSESTTEEDLKKVFGEHGKITSVIVMRDGDSISKCFGFVNFENADDAAKAVEDINGKKFNDKEWYAGKALKKYEREIEFKERFDQVKKESADKYQGLNLYVKNLDDSINDDKLKELFSEFGTITSCKVMCDPSGVSRGSGFVAFSTPEEASRALAEMNGKMVICKPLYVSLAQRKEERKASLQAQFSQVRPLVMAPSVVPPRMPMYPLGAPGTGQQLFYGQVPPQAAGFGYRPQLMHGMRPGGAPMPNYIRPMGPQGQRPGGRRGMGPAQQTQQLAPQMQQRMFPRGRGSYTYPPARNNTFQDHTHLPVSASVLASALAHSTPEHQRMILGESLYPLVDKVHHESSAKVTGMLLEMDQKDILHLIESPQALKAKVEEAIEVLQNVAQQHKTPDDHFASLSLN